MKNLLKIPCAVILGVSVAQTNSFAQTDGGAKLEVALQDYNGSGTRHWAVVWVTTASGTFIKSLRKQGPSWTSTHWDSHCLVWNTARGGSASGSQALDGYSSATAQDYAGTNSPIIWTWNCRDAGNNLMADGNYRFWVQYAEDSGQGPHTTNGLLWTKGPAGATNTYVNLGANFANMKVTWTPSTSPPLAPTITSAPPTASGTVGVPYNYTCTATGTPPIRFAATGLPTGLAISTNGIISGTPTTAGTFPGTITATNGILPNATQNFSIVISAAPVAPRITSAPPTASGTVGVPYNYTCTATGTPPIRFTATGLPTGLTISADGIISGTPTTAGTFPGTITATNGILPNASQNFSIAIEEHVNTYVGSAVCVDCHSAKYQQLQQSIHSQMIRVDAHLPGVIHGDLRKPNAPTTNNVNWVMGGWYKEESYIRTNWTGSNWTYTVTEFQWDPIAGTYVNNQSLRDWTVKCAGCHTTGYDPATRTWSELNIGCESCHGPAGDHVDSQVNGNGTIFPVIDRSSESCGHCHIRAESLAMGSFTNQQFNFPIGYVVGQPNTLQFIPEPLSATASFFPNGTSKRHRQQYLDMNHPSKTPTKHYQQGVSCTQCHDPHTAGIVSTYTSGLPANTFGIKIYDNVNRLTNHVAWDGGRLWHPTSHAAIAQANRSDLCKACHSTVADHHVHQFNATALAANVTCADCHMPDVINVDPTTRRGALHPHTFAAIKPGDSMKYGPTSQPNSCTYRCHQAQGATVAERAAWADSILTHRVAPLVSSGHPSGVRVVGTPEYQYAIQASSNLTSWTSLTTNTAAPLLNAAPRWGFEYIEPGSGVSPQRFYRSKQIVPAP